MTSNNAVAEPILTYGVVPVFKTRQKYKYSRNGLRTKIGVEEQELKGRKWIEEILIGRLQKKTGDKNEGQNVGIG